MTAVTEAHVQLMTTNMDCVLRNLGLTVIADYLDGATYHNFYFLLQDTFQSKKDSKINECLDFLKNNSNINYAQAIVSVYCKSIINWNETDIHTKYYDNQLNNDQTIKFKDVTLPIKMIDHIQYIQKLIEHQVKKLQDSPFAHYNYAPNNIGDCNWHDLVLANGENISTMSFYFEFTKTDKYENNFEWMKTNIYYSIHNDRLDILSILLLETETKTKNKNNQLLNSDIFCGQTPLIVACYTKRNDIIKYLLSIGANPNIQHNNGINSALYFAIINEQIEIVQCLIDHGADVNATWKKNGDVILISISEKTFDVLIKNQLDANIVNTHGQNLITCICSCNCVGKSCSMENFEQLILATTDINQKDSAGKTAVDYATDPQCVQLLKKNGARRQVIKYTYYTTSTFKRVRDRFYR